MKGVIENLLRPSVERHQQRTSVERVSRLVESVYEQVVYQSVYEQVYES